ncbi:MAG TPA: hypothetical protein VFV66_27340 [Nonomuraea sp.]|nr:hypothetical protein [Nonomuraea sp.]
MTSSAATDLPEFDAEDPAWADLLWSAARRRHEQSITVLAEHCRRRDAEPVLRWLEDGPGAYRWLAGRLLVEGVPAGEGHTAAFVASLGHSLRGDLRMTHLAAAEFLDLATRTRIPAVRETLEAALQEAAWDWPWSLGPAVATALAVHDPEAVVRIVREMVIDPDTEVCARVSAAGVLAKADELHVGSAVDIIRAVVADHRSDAWHAIEVLVDLAPRLTDDLVGRVAEMLRDVLRSGALPPTQVGVARLLARLGARYTTEAVGLLRHLPRGDYDGHEGEGRAEAARGLLEVDPPHTTEAIALLREVLAGHYPLDRLHAATTLGRLGPGYEDEAAGAARAVAHSCRDASIRVDAARTLAGLGRRHSAEAAGILRAVLADIARSDPDAGRAASLVRTPRPDANAAAELAELGPPYTAEAAGILRAMISGPVHPVDADRNVSAARALADIGPQHIGEATGALRRLLADALLDAYPRVRIVQALAELDRRHDDDITAALHTVAADPGAAQPFPLTHCLRALARDHPRHTADVADTLGAVLLGAVTRQTPTERGMILGSVRDLTELSAGHPAAVNVLRAVIDDSADASERIRAATMLAQRDPAAVREVLALLGSLIADPSAEPRDGAHALVALHGLGRDHRDRVVGVMRQLLARPGVDACTRVRTVLNVADLDQWYDDDVAAALRAVAADPGTDEPYLTMSWLRDVAQKRPRHTTDVAAALSAVTTRTASDPLTRVYGARLLSQLDSRHASGAADILRAVLADPATAPPPVIGAASALAALGPEYVTEALQALHAVTADPDVAQRDRLQAARLIRQLEADAV